jgi:hypothetical protein
MYSAICPQGQKEIYYAASPRKIHASNLSRKHSRPGLSTLKLQSLQAWRDLIRAGILAGEVSEGRWRAAGVPEWDDVRHGGEQADAVLCIPGW